MRISKIANLSDNIALRLAAPSVRIVAPIPGRHAVGIEVPNNTRETVWFREVGRVQWRHVESASLEPRSARASDGDTYRSLHLVLNLRTQDEWVLEVEGMEHARRNRPLAHSARDQVRH